jgi:hypothetical protein
MERARRSRVIGGNVWKWTGAVLDEGCLSAVLRNPTANMSCVDQLRGKNTTGFVDRGAQMCPMNQEDQGLVAVSVGIVGL